ncbi:hypothetical protein WPS_25890 [Vulcanimicrobium alpinum]|uniref:Uncharacterized protein n=1 Tax=Vulcanimicrobium alpinum TaxID=3016050 RepID=A0AAN1XZM3_UNVUL|nr:hypothetical protein [Vulcanimicrobium alpinum]BDE07313.1 hypothetical protein WPS_25890 [Vulcanimicrobium alpinum]
MRTASVFSAAALAVCVTTAGLAAVAAAATPNPGNAAALATAKAQLVTLRAMHGSGAGGTVQLSVIGRTRTRVVVRIPQGGAYALTLHPGSDCNDNRALAQSLALAPLNAAGTGAPTSSTVVDVPLETLRSGDYVVDVRKATERSAVAQACARLTR